MDPPKKYVKGPDGKLMLNSEYTAWKRSDQSPPFPPTDASAMPMSVAVATAIVYEECESSDDERTKNDASGVDACCSGGLNNIASGTRAVIGGGADNKATGEKSTIGGGQRNKAAKLKSTVSGGAQNKALGPMSTVSGGNMNSANARSATVSGGENNVAKGIFLLLREDKTMKQLGNLLL